MERWVAVLERRRNDKGVNLFLKSFCIELEDSLPLQLIGLDRVSV